MVRKTLSTESIIFIFLIAGFSQELQSNEMMFVWFISGAIFGLVYAEEFPSIFQEVIAVFVMILLGLVLFDIFMDVELYSNQNEFLGDSSSTFSQPVLIVLNTTVAGLLVIVAAFITSTLRTDVFGKSSD